MNTLETRRVMVGNQAVELWECPEARFDCTPQALQRYAASGQWVKLFNALTLQTAPLRAE